MVGGPPLPSRPLPAPLYWPLLVPDDYAEGLLWAQPLYIYGARISAAHSSPGPAAVLPRQQGAGSFVKAEGSVQDSGYSLPDIPQLPEDGEPSYP